MEPLGADESYPSSLKHLDLTGNEIEGNCLENSILMSAYSCPIVSLILSSNPLSDLGRRNICLITKKNEMLRELSVNKCGFDLKTLMLLTSSLHENNSLEMLHIDRPLLTTIRENDVIDHFSRVIQRSIAIRDLSFKYHDILDQGARFLSDALTVNQSLIALNLECNKIGIAGAEALASYLLVRKHNSVRSLCLSYNFVGDDGSIALAEVRLYLSSFRSYDIYFIGFTTYRLSQ